VDAGSESLVSAVAAGLVAGKSFGLLSLDVSEQVDISPIVADYDSEKGGQPPFHPRMIVGAAVVRLQRGRVLVAENHETLRDGCGASA
jgi:hypothetical protein